MPSRRREMKRREMKPHQRNGLLGTLKNVKGDLAMCQFAVGIAANTPVYVSFQHKSDGYEETRPFVVKSIERNAHPHPHVVKGVLQIDYNRPGQDSGDDAHDVQVVVEIWAYPVIHVYSAYQYQTLTEQNLQNSV
jgi:hypothetical protein